MIFDVTVATSVTSQNGLSIADASVAFIYILRLSCFIACLDIICVHRCETRY